MASVDLNGIRFEYAEDGSGEPLVLVHGSASDYRTWQAQRDAFAEQFRVLTYSRRYHWPNEPISEGVDYSMQEHVDDVQAFLHALNAAPAHLVGHSYGALLCLLLALREPSRVRTLVLAEPPVITLVASNPPTPFELLKLFATRPRTAAALLRFGMTGVVPATKAFQRGDTEAGIRIFGDAVFGRGSYDRLPESRKALIQDNRTAIRAEFLGSGFMPLGADAVHQVQIPTLLVSGEHSISLFHRLTDRLGELLPQAERVEVPGASHRMHEDNASAFNATVLSFLARHSQAASPSA